MSIFKKGKEILRVWLTDGITDVIIDIASRSLAVIGVSHRRIHAGDHYEISDYVDLPTSTSRKFIFVTPDTLSWSHFVHEISFEKESTVIFTEGVSTDADGTIITPFNNNRNSANTPILAVTHTPINPTGGTVIMQHRSGDNNKAGGLTRGDNEIILKQDTKYMIEVINQSAQNSLTDWTFGWYET